MKGPSHAHAVLLLLTVLGLLARPRIAEDEEKSFELVDGVRRLRASFTSHDVSFTNLASGKRLTLAFEGLDRGEGARGPSVTRVEPARSSSSPSATGRNERIEYRRGSIVEWYTAGRRGVEQGFDVLERVPGLDREPLTLRIAIGGDYRASMSESTDEGDRVVLRTSDAHGTVAYGKVEAHDANGRVLPSRIGVIEGLSIITIHVDDRDARYPLVVDPLVWAEHEVLLGPAVPLAGSFGTSFGAQVAAHGDTLLVTAPDVDDFRSAVHLYERKQNAWHDRGLLDPGEPLPAGASFGFALGIDGARAIASAPGASAIYVFERSGGVGSKWERTAKITPSDLADPVMSASFGFSLALDGDTLAVGAPFAGGPNPGGEPGAVYIFTRVGNAWTERTKLLAPGSPHVGGSLALSGDTAIVGAVHPFESRPIPPTVHFFVGAGGTWTDQVVMHGEAPGGGDSFGRCVTIDGNVAAVGGPDSGGPKVALGGYVKVYSRSATTSWTENQTLRASDAAKLNAFGEVVLHGNRLYVGASGWNGARGAVYLFENGPTGFAQRDRVTASDGAVDDYFGIHLAFTNDMLFAATPFRNFSQGGVYVFFHGSEGDPCTNGDICNSGLCIDGVCCDTTCGGGDPNDCMACSVAAGAKKDGICGAASARACRPAKGECDVAETCDGVSATCPADVTTTNGTACGAGNGRCGGGQCLPIATVSTTDAGVPAANPSDDASCACRAHPARTSVLDVVGVGGAFALALRRRQRRSQVRFGSR